MGANTSIEWADHTWTPVVGCDAISPACASCYAATMAARLAAMGMPKYAGLATRHGAIGKWTGEVTVWDPEIDRPLSVKKPGTWFLTSMGDVGHEKVSDETLDRLFAVMALTPHHIYYVLTKRPERIRAYLESRRHVPGYPLPNVFIGSTVEDQERADERRPHMAAIAALGWRTLVSYEPALGLVNWNGWEFLCWLIGGGESGPKARPMHPDWQRAARDWCAGHGIPYLFKQWGAYEPAIDRERADPDWRADYSRKFADSGRTRWINLAGGRGFHGERFHVMRRTSKKAAGRLLDGVEHNGFPGGASC